MSHEPQPFSGAGGGEGLRNAVQHKGGDRSNGRQNWAEELWK